MSAATRVHFNAFVGSMREMVNSMVDECLKKRAVSKQAIQTALLRANCAGRKKR